MTTRILMAKSFAPNRSLADSSPYSASLLGHTEQCIDVAKLFNDYATTFMVQTCGSRKEVHVEWFRKALILVAGLHDIGKATDSFQSQLQGKGKPTPYLVRHEVVSHWLVTKDTGLKEAIQEYFSDSEMERFVPLVEGAILGHHLKFPRKSLKMKSGARYHQGPINVLINTFRQSGVVPLLGDVLGTAFDMTQGETILGTEDWLNREVKEPFEERLRAQKYSEVEQMLGSMLRGALIAVDTIGSLQFQTKDEWLQTLAMFRESWQARLTLSQGFEQVVEEHLKGKKRNQAIDEFQRTVTLAQERTVIVEAGCGLGKTVAAYRRAAHLGSRGMFVTFPTTSVASQLYADYGEEGTVESQLLHSRSVVDMEMLYAPPSEEDGGTEEDTAVAVEESLRRLMAPVTFSTVDAVLGILQMRRSSLCLLPVICQSMLVFDEIHSYSPELFKHLLAFVRYFEVPMVMMTATLPPAYKVALRTALDVKPVAWIRGPETIESVLRYRLRVDNESIGEGLSHGMLTRVRQAVQAGQKVLIVINRVEWAKSVFKQLASEPDLQTVARLFHSRFKYLDRLKIQHDLVQRFHSINDPIIAVTTQISEISFDISADLLISHVAPFASMVQRLGRLNRGPRPDPERLGEAIFVVPPGDAPYRRDEITTGHEFSDYLRKNSEVRMSQLALRSWLDQLNQAVIHEKPKEKFTWFDLHVAIPGDSLREPGFTMDVILQSDFKQTVTSTDRLKVVLPLPARLQQSTRAKKWRHCSIVDDSEVDYCDSTGGEWRRD